MLTTIYWLNPVTSNVTPSLTDVPDSSFGKVSAPGYRWTVAQQGSSSNGVIWGGCTGSRLHYRTNQNPEEGGTWRSVAAEGVQLMYNDPVTNTWKPVCSAEAPIYGNIDGQWIPLCCSDDYVSPFD